MVTRVVDQVKKYLIKSDRIVDQVKKYLIKSNISKRSSFYKPFENIPTLKSYPTIGHSYLFLPWGKYKAERLTEALLDISKKLGPIFMLKFNNLKMVVTLNPDDTRTLYNNEGKMPIRPPFSALKYYRKTTFNTTGIVPGSGEEWYKLRKGVTPLLMFEIIEPYKKYQEQIAKRFVKYIENHRDRHCVLSDIYPHLLKYAIEAISVVSPGYHFHCLLNNDKEANEIIQANNNFMDGLYKTLIEPPFWKIWKTSGYKKLESSHNTIYRILKIHLEERRKEFEENPSELKQKQPYMFALFNNDNLSWDEKVMLAVEIFLGGLDATATTISFTLYYLSNNSKIQKIARNSLSSGTDFLKACIRETLRLSPTAGGNSRFLNSQAVMSGFLIPKGTLVLSLNSVSSRNEKYFEQPNTYFPQRFVKGTREHFHRFASLPFGHGPRMCPGKRLVENEMVILLAEILRNFKLERTETDDVGMIVRMNRIPDRPINIKFTNH